MLDERVIAQPLHPGAISRRAGRLWFSLRVQVHHSGVGHWHELHDGAHARTRQAFRPVQSTHQSSCCRFVNRERDRQSVATAKREFGRFVLSGVGSAPFGMEACA